MILPRIREDMELGDEDSHKQSGRLQLQRKLDCVQEERRILQEQVDALAGGKKVFFTADQRRRLATAGEQLTPDERRKCAESELQPLRGAHGKGARRSRLGGMLNFYYREAA